MSHSWLAVGLIVFAAGALTLLLREPLWFVLAIVTIALGFAAAVGILLLHALVRREP